MILQQLPKQCAGLSKDDLVAFEHLSSVGDEGHVNHAGACLHVGDPPEQVGLVECGTIPG